MDEEKNTITESEAQEAADNAETVELTPEEVEQNLESAEILEVVPDEMPIGRYVPTPEKGTPSDSIVESESELPSDVIPNE